MKPLRVAHLVNEIIPAGKETGIVKLIRHQDQRHFSSIIIASEGVHPLHFEKIEDIPIYTLNKRPGNDWSLPGKIARICRDERIDIIHSHAWGTLLEGYLAVKIAACKCWVHTEHGTLKDQRIHRIAQSILWRRVDALSAVSMSVKVRMSEISGINRERINVIYNGVDTAMFYPSQALRAEFREKFGFKESDLIIGSVGRFLPIKNHQMLVRAAAEVIRAGKKIELVLVSLGPLQEQLQKLAEKLNIVEHLHFLGLQKNINLIMNGFDIFVLPSLSEGCSNVIQEAMMCARPVVATRVGGNPELVREGETGRLVESNHPAQLAAALLELISNEKQRNLLGENGRKTALEKYTVEKMVSDYQQFYINAYQKNHAG